MFVENRLNTKAKIAIVTGGNRGLGRNTLLNLAKIGVKVIFTYRSNKAEADHVIEEVNRLGSQAIALQLDTAISSRFDDFIQQTEQALVQLGAQRFDYLVNNAGSSLHKSFELTNEDEFDSVYNVHVKGVFFLTQKLLPLINNGGCIINISSGLTRFSFPGSIAYAAMKGAVEVMTRYMALELAARAITVNTVAPGAIATDFSGGLIRDNPEANLMVARKTALGRVGQPDDIGPMITALLSDANRWVTAQRIEVSGGMLL